MRRLTFSLALAALACGCSQVEPVEPVREGTEVLIYFDRDYESPGTRSSVLGPEVESVESGAVVALYDAATGRLDSQFRVASMDTPLKASVAAKRMNVYVLGNLWLMDTFGKPFEIVFPVLERDAEAMVYRLGGKDAGDGLRTETFADLDRYGIPACGVLRDVDVASTPEMRVSMARLFARVEVTIDHSGISSTPGVFSNSSMHVRQANGRLVLFAAGGSRAIEAGDLLEACDYESPMRDGQLEKYSFYVPENMMGTLMPDNRFPGMKDHKALKAAAGDAADLATYIDFLAVLDKSAAGFGGKVAYRFYLGTDNVTNFDVRRNTPYHVTMSFKLNSIFAPNWKVSVGEDFSDGRLFCVTKDADYSQPLDCVVAVRKNRAANVYVYMNKSGAMGANELLGKPLVAPGYESRNIEDCAWGADFSALEQYGMRASYSPSDARLSLTVTDPSRFVAGKEIPVPLVLYPGGRTTTVKVVTCEDLGVDLDASDFYMGMKRRATLRGFVGGSGYVRMSSAGSPQLFRTSTDQAKEMVGGSRKAFSGRSVDLYAYGYCPSSPVTLEFSSSDSFNDGTASVDVMVHKPRFSAETVQLKLRIDGTDVPVNAVYKDRNGAVMDKGVFDPQLYSQLLTLTTSYSNLYGDKYVSFDGEAFFVDYLGSNNKSDWIGGLINSDSEYNVHPDCLGSAQVRPVSPVFTEYSTYNFLIYYPCYKTPFPRQVVSDYYNTTDDESFCVAAEYYTYGNTELVLSVSSGDGTPVELVTENVTEDLVRMELRPKTEGVLAPAPLGTVRIMAGFRNIRARNGTTSIFKDNPTTFTYNVTLGQFAVFRKNSPMMTVYITYPRAAYYMKRYFEGGGDMPTWTSVAGKGGYNNYLSWTRMKTISAGTQQQFSGTGNQTTMMYADFFPGAYPSQLPFDESSAAIVAGDNWLYGLTFSSGGMPLEQPLLTQYSGSPYLNIRVSGTKLGYVVI